MEPFESGTYIIVILLKTLEPPRLVQRVKMLGRSFRPPGEKTGMASSGVLFPVRLPRRSYGDLDDEID